jgi:hypothetical protein
LWRMIAFFLKFGQNIKSEQWRRLQWIIRNITGSCHDFNLFESFQICTCETPHDIEKMNRETESPPFQIRYRYNRFLCPLNHFFNLLPTRTAYYLCLSQRYPWDGFRIFWQYIVKDDRVLMFVFVFVLVEVIKQARQSRTSKSDIPNITWYCQCFNPFELLQVQRMSNPTRYRWRVSQLFVGTGMRFREWFIATSTIPLLPSCL